MLRGKTRLYGETAGSAPRHLESQQPCEQDQDRGATQPPCRESDKTSAVSSGCRKHLFGSRLSAARVADYPVGPDQVNGSLRYQRSIGPIQFRYLLPFIMKQRK